MLLPGPRREWAPLQSLRWSSVAAFELRVARTAGTSSPCRLPVPRPARRRRYVPRTYHLLRRELWVQEGWVGGRLAGPSSLPGHATLGGEARRGSHGPKRAAGAGLLPGQHGLRLDPRRRLVGLKPTRLRHVPPAAAELQHLDGRVLTPHHDPERTRRSERGVRCAALPSKPLPGWRGRRREGRPCRCQPPARHSARQAPPRPGGHQCTNTRRAPLHSSTNPASPPFHSPARTPTGVLCLVVSLLVLPCAAGPGSCRGAPERQESGQSPPLPEWRQSPGLHVHHGPGREGGCQGEWHGTEARLLGIAAPTQAGTRAGRICGRHGALPQALHRKHCRVCDIPAPSAPNTNSRCLFSWWLVISFIAFHSALSSSAISSASACPRVRASGWI